MFEALAPPATAFQPLASAEALVQLQQPLIAVSDGDVRSTKYLPQQLIMIENLSIGT